MMNTLMKKQRALIDKFYQKYRDSFFDEMPAAHAEELLAFQQEEFGEQAHQPDDDFNAWMYLKNKKNKRIYCFANGQVVGQQSAIATTLVLGDQEHDAAYAIDLRVCPEWKMKGLGVALIGSLMSRYDLLVGLGVSDEAYAMFKRQGWIDQGELNFYLKPVSSGILKPAYTKGSMLLWFRNLAALLYSSAFDLIRMLLPSRFKVSSKTQFTQQHVQLCEKLSCHYTNRMKRDLAYLQWRFCECSAKNAYQIVDCESANGELKGFMVVRQSRWNDLDALLIVELQAEVEAMGSLVSEALRIARSRKVDVVLGQCLDARVEPVLKSSGFIRRKSGTRFLVYCSREDLQQKIQAASDWQVSFSESDLDYSFMDY
jgi:hypothetical protein